MANNKPFKYSFNCVEVTQKEVHHLQKAIDDAREITWTTFSKICDYVDIEREVIGESGIKLKDDWAVSFYSSMYKGKKCYYFRHSSIEYVFV